MYKALTTNLGRKSEPVDPIEQVDFDDMPSKAGTFLKNCRIMVFQVDKPKILKLYRKLAKLGGCRIVDSIEENPTHIVVPPATYPPESNAKLKCAQESGIFVVKTGWLIDCVSAQTSVILNFHRYAAADVVKATNVQDGENPADVEAGAEGNRMMATTNPPVVLADEAEKEAMKKIAPSVKTGGDRTPKRCRRGFWKCLVCSDVFVRDSSLKHLRLHLRDLSDGAMIYDLDDKMEPEMAYKIEDHLVFAHGVYGGPRFGWNQEIVEILKNRLYEVAVSTQNAEKDHVGEGCAAFWKQVQRLQPGDGVDHAKFESRTRPTYGSNEYVYVLCTSVASAHAVVNSMFYIGKTKYPARRLREHVSASVRKENCNPAKEALIRSIPEVFIVQLGSFEANVAAGIEGRLISLSRTCREILNLACGKYAPPETFGLKTNLEVTQLVVYLAVTGIKANFGSALRRVTKGKGLRNPRRNNADLPDVDEADSVARSGPVDDTWSRTELKTRCEQLGLTAARSTRETLQRIKDFVSAAEQFKDEEEGVRLEEESSGADGEESEMETDVE